MQGETCRISVAPGMDVPMRADAAGGRFILVPFVQNEATEMQYGIAVCGRVRYRRGLHVGTQACVPPPGGQLPRQGGAVRRSGRDRASGDAPPRRVGRRGGHERQNDDNEPAGRRDRGKREDRGLQPHRGEPGFRRGHVAAAVEGCRLGRIRDRRAVVGKDPSPSAGHLRASPQPVPRR